ncbi:hypothetical protein LJK87_09400 [Paenibacillus sp. P25]|nr:hypothetical protein LJK87_09400 [Paenibacillus sp. P25]
MQLKFIDWRAEYEGEQDHPAHLYHIQSRRGALDSWKERSRLKTLKAFAAHAGKNIHASKRYFSAPGYSLASPESAPAGLRPALAVLARLHASPEAPLLDYAPLEEALEPPADALHRPDLYYLDLSEGEAALYYYCAPTAELQFVRSAEAGQAVRWFPARSAARRRRAVPVYGESPAPPEAVRRPGLPDRSAGGGSPERTAGRLCGSIRRPGGEADCGLLR